jgi:peptidoglycan/xylan/chitin deacetylase (PgdA/CDA1 family)
MSIGTHGMTHRPWRGLHPAHQREELVSARRVIAEVIGAPVRDAALPLGRYDRRLLAQLRPLDYRSIHTSDRRWARTADWLQPRYSIRRNDTASGVQREVLTFPPLHARASRALVGTAKRWR